MIRVKNDVYVQFFIFYSINSTSYPANILNYA